MRWTFDLDSDSLYVSLRDTRSTRQVELPSGVVIDVDPEGRAVGVEILRASAGWSPTEITDRFNIERSDAESLKWLSETPFPAAHRHASGVAARPIGEPGTDQTVPEPDLQFA
jgi:uncharacterized protein YuzE